MSQWGAPQAIYVEHTPTGLFLRVRTPAPCHLWLGYQPQQPLKRQDYRPLRGIPLIRGLSYTFTAPLFLEQEELGDTLTHSWPWPSATGLDRIHFFLTDTIASPDGAATSPPFIYPWERNVIATQAVILRRAASLPVGALGFHELRLDTVVQAVNWNGRIDSLSGGASLDTPGVYNVTCNINLFSTGTGNWRLFLGSTLGVSDPSFYFRESASEAHASYELSANIIATSAWSFVPVLQHISGANGATAGDGTFPAVELRIALVGAL